MPNVGLHDFCNIEINKDKKVDCQVIGFSEEKIILSALGDVSGISPRSKITANYSNFFFKMPSDPIGLVLDSSGRVLNKNYSGTHQKLPYFRQAPPALSKMPCANRVTTGVKAIDAFCPIAEGQRMVVLAGAGCGKSTLLGMLTKFSSADVIVVGLVGERGREVNHFISENLSVEGLKKSVLVVSTSSEPALNRQLAAHAATTIAEHYRDQGANVLLIIDSLTRFARASREIAISAGQIPMRQGWPSSVFNELASLIERAGNNHTGSITAFYTMLASMDGTTDLLAEEVMSITDGHILLDQKLADQQIKPALNILNSLSRLADSIQDNNEKSMCQKVKLLLSTLEKEKDLVSLGGNPSQLYLSAQKYEPIILDLLKQLPDQFSNLDETRKLLEALTH
jgi:flagellum-specific ATP synthase